MPSPVAKFLLTRYNVRLAFGSPEQRRSPAWLEERWSLFTRFCVPSVRAQTARDFHWLVLVDEGTPVEFLSRFTSLAEEGLVDLVRTPEDWKSTCLRRIAESLPDGARTVLTARLDSDDALAADFIQVAGEAAESGVRGVLSFPRGFVWSGGRLYLRDYQDNPFAVTAEPREDFRTVFRATHEQLRDEAPVHYLCERPSWVQVVHGGNESNAVVGLRVLAPRLALDGRFPDSLAVHPEESSAEAIVDMFRSLAHWRTVVAPLRRRLGV